MIISDFIKLRNSYQNTIRGDIVINDIILYIMIIFMFIGGFDRILGNKYGYGKAFDEGFEMMGALALAMVGAIAISPILAQVLKPLIVPFYNLIGADPGMFPPSIFAIDMGGYTISKAMTSVRSVHLFGGVILGSMLGTTVIFSIPVGLSILDPEDHEYFAKGMLYGIITIPIGCFIGGIIAGFDMELILINSIPIVLFSLIIAAGLFFIPKKIIALFSVLGKFMVVLITLSLMLGAIHVLTGIELLTGMSPLSEAFIVVGKIALILSGAFPLIHFIEKHFEGYLIKIGNKFDINQSAVVGILSSLASNILSFKRVKDMNVKGKVICISFLVSGSFTFGGQLGYAASIDKNIIFPLVVAKLTAGVTAMILANFLHNRKEQVER